MNKVSKAEVAALLASGEFDERSYLDKYPDVQLVGMSAAEHFLWIGKRLGRTMGPAAERAPRHVAPVETRARESSDPGELTFNCDFLRVRRDRFFMFGWAIHSRDEIERLTLIAEQGSASVEYAVAYGERREDVARDWGAANANSGFMCRGKLPTERPAKFVLQVDLRSGARRRVQVQESPPSESQRREVPSSFARASDAASKAVKEAAEQCRADGARLAVVIDHSLGGGANRYRRRVVDAFRENGAPVLLVTYDVVELELIAQFTSDGVDLHFRLDQLEDVFAFTELFPLGDIFLNNFFSFENALEFADFAVALKERTGADATFALHDFLAVCPSYTLLNATGEFCGVPDIDTCKACLRNHGGEFREFVDDTDIVGWRERWAPLLSSADKILCFSNSSKDLLTRAYPNLEGAGIEVRPHVVDYLPPRKPNILPVEDLNIGVCGTISLQKGSRVLKRLAEFIRERKLPYKITVFGSVSEPLPSDVVTVLGSYDTDALPRLIENHGANVFLLPSIWPETFSYVAEELMQMDVPLAVFDLGAPAERVRNYAKGAVLQSMEPEAILQSLRELKNKAAGSQGPARVATTSAPSRARVSNAGAPIHVFTSAAANYIPKVRILCESIKKHHPEFMVHLALADKRPEWLDLSREPFDSVIAVDDLPIPNRTSWTFGHTIIELSTAIKPFTVRHLLSQPGVEKVFYFDPDMVLFDRVDDMIGALSNANIVLTPHQTKPERESISIIDNEICSMKHGIFNLGFIGVRNTDEGRKFAAWWSHRLYHFCREELHNGLWTDQKWIDHVPVFFDDVTLLKSSRFNVAPWNLTTRKVAGDHKRGFTVDGDPLGFYHFTGFDSGAHDIMAGKYAGDNPAVMGLVDWYKKRSAEVSDKLVESTPWAFGAFDNGEKITWEHRIIYRMRKDLQEIYPDPFHVVEDGQCYYNWFNWCAQNEHPEVLSFGRTRKEKLLEKTLERAMPLVPFATRYDWEETWAEGA